MVESERISALPFTPVIIIGAGRSGTNALRDMICSLEAFSTWPCDEINPIWRHGNVGWPTDAIPIQRATPKIKHFIRSEFLKEWRRRGQPQYLVEKTCANAMRVDFVNAVLPEAKFVHIQRSGQAIVPSARKRWKGDIELDLIPYIAAKARFTPWRELPVYGWHFFKARIDRLSSSDGAFSSWGPRFDKMDHFARLGLDDVCAAQWAHCVISASNALIAIPNDRKFEFRYETLLRDPNGVLNDFLRYVGAEAGSDDLSEAATIIRPSSGKSSPPLQIAEETRKLVLQAEKRLLPI